MKNVIKTLKIAGIVILSIVVVLFAFVGITSQMGNTRVKAEIDGLGFDLIAVKQDPINNNENRQFLKNIKFAYCINDKIDFKVSSDELLILHLSSLKEFGNHFRSKNIKCFVTPNDEVVKIKGKLKKHSIDYNIVEGNELNHQLVELYKELLPHLEKETKYYLKRRRLEETDSAKAALARKKFNRIRFDVTQPKMIEFAKKHPDYELSTKYLLNSNIPKDTVIKYFNQLSEDARNFHYGQIISKKIKGWNNTKIGASAPNFSKNTLKGNTFKLAQVQDKYIVLDFWGTWCAPCLSGIPKMKEYYKKYNQSVEFVGIACKDKKEKWEKTIKEKNMNWIQIFNTSKKRDLSQVYGIRGYPTKFIINKQGKIIGRYKGETKAFYNALDSIMLQ